MTRPTAYRKGQKLTVLTSYSEQLRYEDQRYLRQLWHRLEPTSRWLRFDEIDSVLHTAHGPVHTLPADYKLLVMPTDDAHFTWGV